MTEKPYSKLLKQLVFYSLLVAIWQLIYTFAVLPPSVLPSPKDVFGWLPYWQWSSLPNMQWDLLTHVAYFGVDATSTGSLSGLNSWNTRGSTFVPTCHAAGVRALLSVELFSSGSINTLLSSATYRQNLITNLIAQVTPYGADGIAIDFEGMPVA